MRNPAIKFLTVFLALAIAGLPLHAYACNMDMLNMDLDVQHQDHSTMQMSHPDGADSDCCNPERANTPGDCAGFMNCGSCVAGTSMISPLPQPALVCLHATAFDTGSGKVLPSHSSPPYHPPIS